MTRRICLMILTCFLANGGTAQAQSPAPAKNGPSAKRDYKWLIDRYLVPIDSRDPLVHISGEMGWASEFLGKLHTDEPTQLMQKDIVTELDQIIAMLEKRRKNGKAGGGANPYQPLPDSVIAGGPGGQGDLRDPNASTRLWGQLPPKQREQILQSQNQGFPAGYEEILSAYYKRLSQDNAEAPVSAAPATQPGAR